MKYLLVLLTSSLSTAKVTFQSQLAKKESRSVADNIFFNTLIFFAASLLFLPYLFSASLKIWAYAAVYAFCNVLFQIVYSVALSRGNVSVAVMFANFGMLVPVAFSVALFGDTPSVFRIVGICLIMVALVFTLKKGGISQKGYRWLVLFCMLANGCGLTVQKLFALSGEGGSIFSFVSAGYLLSALMCAVSYGGAVVITKPQKKMRASSHYVTPGPALSNAIVGIKEELTERLAYFKSVNKLLEEQRLREKTNFDIEMLESTGYCKSIENYSRYLTGRPAGAPPPTLFEYLPEDAIVFIDESHVSVPQIGGMYNGDRARKTNLSEYGFRLPSCLDNRPLKFEEWNAFRGRTVYISATPGDWELEQSDGKFIEQLIRPTGLLDPEVEVRPLENQVDDLMHECRKVAKSGGRVLCTTLTKKMAEQLTDYLCEYGIKVRYLHSDIDTLERIEIIRDLRMGKFDVLVGINLLREGLDIPECQLVAILDADKEGFLRSERSLIQTIGRAARNAEGRVILYADKITKSMSVAMTETARRRKRQMEYNKEHNITPKTIIKKIASNIADMDYVDIETNPVANKKKFKFKNKDEITKLIKTKEKEMLKLADNLEFEKATLLRDEIKELEKIYLELV